MRCLEQRGVPGISSLIWGRSLPVRTYVRCETGVTFFLKYLRCIRLINQPGCVHYTIIVQHPALDNSRILPQKKNSALRAENTPPSLDAPPHQRHTGVKGPGFIAVVNRCVISNSSTFFYETAGGFILKTQTENNLFLPKT
jgi:hypothetical protein